VVCHEREPPSRPESGRGAAAASERHALAGDHSAALAAAESGLALWEGISPDADGGHDDPVAGLRARLRPVYWSLARGRALALSRLGRPSDAVTPLADLCARHPRDEELLVELLRCEAATTGPAAALERYERYRRALRDELGADPGAALRALHDELLRAATPPAWHGGSPTRLIARSSRRRILPEQAAATFPACAPSGSRLFHRGFIPLGTAAPHGWALARGWTSRAAATRAGPAGVIGGSRGPA
jgi:hypothetical protein